MLPPHWSTPWSPSWSEEHPICLSQCSAHTAVGTLLQGMSEIFWLVGLLHKTSWAQGSLFSVFPRPDSGPDMCSVNVGWMDESSSPKGSVFIHSFIPSINTYWTPTIIKHTKHSIGTGNTAVSKADKNVYSHGLPEECWKVSCTVLIPKCSINNHKCCLWRREMMGRGEGREISSYATGPILLKGTGPYICYWSHQRLP